MLNFLSAIALFILLIPLDPALITINFIICAALYFFVKDFQGSAPKSILALILTIMHQSFFALRFHRLFTYTFLFKYLGMPNEVMSVFKIFKAPVPFAVFMLETTLALSASKIIYNYL